METKLLGCPFCKGEVGICTWSHCIVPDHNCEEERGCKLERRFRIYCKISDCLANLLVCGWPDQAIGAWQKDEKAWPVLLAAITAWNLRAPSPATDALVSALLECKKILAEIQDNPCKFIDEALAAVDALKGG